MTPLQRAVKAEASKSLVREEPSFKKEKEKREKKLYMKNKRKEKRKGLGVCGVGRVGRREVGRGKKR